MRARQRAFRQATFTRATGSHIGARSPPRGFARHTFHAGNGTEYQGSVTLGALGDVEVAAYECDPGEIVRATEHISSSDNDDLLICAQFNGQGVAAQDGRHEDSPGQRLRLGSTAPFQLQHAHKNKIGDRSGSAPKARGARRIGERLDRSCPRSQQTSRLPDRRLSRNASLVPSTPSTALPRQASRSRRSTSWRSRSPLRPGRTSLRFRHRAPPRFTGSSSRSSRGLPILTSGRRRWQRPSASVSAMPTRCCRLNKRRSSAISSSSGSSAAGAPLTIRSRS